jgi:hypothetical protein
VSTAISIDGAEEGTFNVDATQDLGERWDACAEGDEGAEAGLHFGERVSDDGGEDALNTLRGELVAGGADAGGVEVVRVEVDAGVAVDLKIEIRHVAACCDCSCGGGGCRAMTRNAAAAR